MTTLPRVIRLEPELWDAISRIAKRDDRSVASLIRHTLRQLAEEAGELHT